MISRIYLVTAALALFSTSAFGYGALSEFISADGTTFRDPSLSATLSSTDLIVDPKWTSGLPIQITLCTGGGFISSNVKHQSSKTNELLADISLAQTAWGFGAGTALTFLSPTTDGCSGSADYDTAHRMIYFTALDAGVLAYTPTTVSVQGGQLVVTDGDIVFTTSSSYQFLTHACDVAGSPSGSCSGGSFPLTFLGILTHEMGHLIGISHTLINYSEDGHKATMYPSVSNISDTRAFESLALDDELARQHLYPETAFPGNTGGTVSGFVKRSSSQGQRAAHVSVFDLSAGRTITGVFSSMSGAFANPDGSFTIEGVPFDTDFALFVEPVDRSGDSLGTSYANINTPVGVALNSELQGFLSFAIEGYPDVSVPDISLYHDASRSPGFASARRFKLTTESPSITGLTFYLSKTKAAPNDATLASFTFNSDKTITDGTPLTLTLNNPNGLDIFSSPTITLAAVSTNGTLDWSAGLSDFTYSGTSSKVSVDRNKIEAPDGSYTVTAVLNDSKYGSISGNAKVTVQSWNASPSPAATASGGGGGCKLQSDAPTDYFAVILFGIAVLALLRIQNQRKSLTSRLSILSKPKQS